MESHPFGKRIAEEGGEVVVSLEDELSRQADKETLQFVQETLLYAGEDSLP